MQYCTPRIYPVPGAALGCLLRGGGGGAKLPKCLASAVRAIKFCASPEKAAQRGGLTPTHFSPNFKKISNTFSEWVGHERPLSWQAKTKKQKQNKNKNHRGGGRRHCPVLLLFYRKRNEKLEICCVPHAPSLVPRSRACHKHFGLVRAYI